MSSSKQIDDLVLGSSCLPRRCPELYLNRTTRRRYQLCSRRNLRERLDRFLPRGIDLSALDFALPRQDLPKPHVCLKDPHRVAAYSVVGDFSKHLGRSQETSDRVIAEIR